MTNRQEPVPDDALMESIQGGDGSAAARLYERHVDRVHRICYRIVPDHSQVQDCVQEVWLKVFRKLGRSPCDGPFAAWLNSVHECLRMALGEVTPMSGGQVAAPTKRPE